MRNILLGYLETTAKLDGQISMLLRNIKKAPPPDPSKKLIPPPQYRVAPQATVPEFCRRPYISKWALNPVLYPPNKLNRHDETADIDSWSDLDEVGALRVPPINTNIALPLSRSGERVTHRLLPPSESQLPPRPASATPVEGRSRAILPIQSRHSHTSSVITTPTTPFDGEMSMTGPVLAPIAQVDMDIVMASNTISGSNKKKKTVGQGGGSVVVDTSPPSPPPHPSWKRIDHKLPKEYYESPKSRKESRSPKHRSKDDIHATKSNSSLQKSVAFNVNADSNERSFERSFERSNERSNEKFVGQKKPEVRQKSVGFEEVEKRHHKHKKAKSQEPRSIEDLVEAEPQILQKEIKDLKEMTEIRDAKLSKNQSEPSLAAKQPDLNSGKKKETGILKKSKRLDRTRDTEDDVIGQKADEESPTRSYDLTEEALSKHNEECSRREQKKAAKVKFDPNAETGNRKKDSRFREDRKRKESVGTEKLVSKLQNIVDAEIVKREKMNEHIVPKLLGIKVKIYNFEELSHFANYDAFMNVRFDSEIMTEAAKIVQRRTAIIKMPDDKPTVSEYCEVLKKMKFNKEFALNYIPENDILNQHPTVIVDLWVREPNSNREHAKFNCVGSAMKPLSDPSIGEKSSWAIKSLPRAATLGYLCVCVSPVPRHAHFPKDFEA
eukprot:Platyproteum_vivax@DN6797_c0_g1_i2.p1